MTQIVDKKLKLMCDCCKSHFDKPCAWLSLGNEYCTEIMEIQKELEEKDKEIERLAKDCGMWNMEYNKQFDRAEKLNNIIEKAIYCINLNQEKSGSLSYENCKRVRGILKGDEFHLKMFEEQIKELKEGSDKDE